VNSFGIRSVILFSILLSSCTAAKFPFKKAYRLMNVQEKNLTDSILQYALDHEALYTLADTLKPMSSVKMYRLPLLSTNPIQADSAYRALTVLQTLASKLSAGDVYFILNPFERADSIYKNLELYAVRKSSMASVIAQHQIFYSKLGISPNTNPATVLAITEYESKYNRWRSYGYLFGYPDYAVDFFVNAGKEQDNTKQFVKRDFFHIPVFAGTSGYFTYAVPKGYQTNERDSVTYRKAAVTLARYRQLRRRFQNSNGVKAVKLWAKETRRLRRE
jgi:hypothetical protein